MSAMINPRPARRPLVLIIDDEPDHAEIVATLLERRGYLAATAPDGRIGVELANRLKPDVVLLDVRMPAVDGYATARQLRRNELTSKVPIVFLSAAAEFTAPEDGSGYLPKPFRAVDLYRAVEEALGG
jgi:CheY-like chemotaxis protein